MSAGELVRVGPVHFQSLEAELEPVTKYLKGRMLNAGCGTRDLRAYLQARGVESLVRYDLDSTDPEVIRGPLEKTPFVDGSFDSVLCNAVLEHVADAEASIRELARVVRPGGHVVVAVPFLQPFHPCPGDYRRYTAAGLGALGAGAGLEVVEVLPVHSFAQTMGWLLWEYAQEKGGRLRRAAAWSSAFLLTRLWNRTDPGLLKNANTYQAVFKRPDVIGTAWRQEPVPEVVSAVPTMLVPDERKLLVHLAEHWFTGQGAIVDAGCFQGGSTVAVAEGLRRNLARRGAPPAKLVHSYDKFAVEDWTRGLFFPESDPAGASFRDRFDANVAPYADLIEVHEGDIREHPWRGGAIEILFLDLAKHWEVCDWVTWNLFPHLIPGRSLLVQQDYLYDKHTAWLHITMEVYADHFTYVTDTEVNSVVFLCTKALPREVLREHTVAELSLERKIELMDRAATRFTGRRREFLVKAKASYLELLGVSWRGL